MTIFRMMKKDIFSFAASLVLLSGFSLFTSCDTGLGESVDTTAPSVSITEPAASASISGNVAITGKCADDKGVAKIVVSVKNAATNDEKRYEIKPTGTDWTASIDKSELKDGTYSVDAVAYDNAGRVSDTANRVFDVDNTPPVFCVTSPNSLIITDPAAFGRTVTVRGEIADDHPIKNMTIRVFKYDTAAGVTSEITGSLAKNVFSGFETAGGTEVEIAHYYPSEADAKTADAVNPGQYSLYQNYMALYSGASVGDTVYYYILPMLTDSAGNTSSCCYIQTQLKQLFSKACGVDTTSDSLQTAQFKKILNDTYSLGELDIGIAKQILAGTYNQSELGTSYKYYSDASEMLAMSVNANNSPRYEFGGYAVDKDELRFKEIASKGNLTVKISAGLDMTPVTVNTVKVYMWECDDTLKKEGGTPAYSSEVGGGIILKDSDGNELNNCDSSVQTTNATYTITLPDSLSAGTCYILTVEGEDISGNGLYSDNTYAFMVAMSGTVPKVDFKDPFFIKASAVSNETGESDCYKARITITDKSGDDGKGTIKDAGNNNNVSVTPCLYKTYIKNKGRLGDYSGEILESIKYSENQIQGADGSYYIDVPLNMFDIDSSVPNYTVALKVRAKNTGATSETNTFIFWADNKAPELNVTSPENNARIFETDSNISSVTEGSSTVYSYSPRGTWSDVDGSGTSKLYYTQSEVTEPPVLSYTPFTGSADSAKTYYLKQAEDCYLAQSGLTGSINASDGYYTLSLTTQNGVEWNEVSGAAATTKQGNWNDSIKVTDALNKSLSFVAVDAVGNMSDIQKRTGLVYDFSVPRVSLSSEPCSSNPVAAQQYYVSNNATDGKFAFKVAASDSSGIKAIDVEAKLNDAVVASGTSGYSLGGYTAGESSRTWTLLNGGTSNGKWSFSIKATDNAGRESSTPLSIKTIIDTANPVRQYYDSASQNYLSVAAGTVNGTENVWYGADTLTIGGRFDEATSGLDTVTYSMTPAKTAVNQNPAPVTETASVGGKCNEKNDDGTVNYVLYKISPTGFTEGSNSLTITASDLAGNKSSSETYTVKIDLTAPGVSAAYYSYSRPEDASNPVLIAASNIVMTNGQNPMTLYGRVTDTLSGIKNLSFTINGTSIKPQTIKYTRAATLDSAENYSGAEWEDWNAANATEYTGYNAVIDKVNLVSGDVYIEASDAALTSDGKGNVTKQKIFAITVDNTPPVINLKSPAKDSEINGSVVVSGTASDTALASISLYVSKDEKKDEKAEIKDTDVIIGSPITDSTMYNWSKTLTASSVKDGKITMLPEYDSKEGYTEEYTGKPKNICIKVLAYDKAGNSKIEVCPYTINPDEDRPKITLTTVNLDGMSKSKPALFTGSSVLDGSISDDDGIKSLQYSTDDGKNWSDLTVKNGTFVIPKDGKLEDGEYSIKFKVVDTAGTTFESSSSPSALSPKLVGKDKKEFSDGDTCLYIKVDTTPPESKNFVYATSATTKNEDYSETSATLGTVGGNKKFVKIAFDAYDKNEVDSVKLELNGKTYSESDSKTPEEKDGKKWYKWTITDIDVSELDSGIYSAQLTITDKSGLKTSDTLKFNVDNTPPVVTVLAPSSTNAVYGNVSMYGSVESADKMYYALSLNGDEKKEPPASDFKEIDASLTTWSIVFDGDTDAQGTHDITLNRFIINEGVTTEEDIKNQTYTDITSVYVWVKAVDDLGNTSKKAHKVLLDPQGGRPTFTYSYPEADDMRVGGTVKLYGGADDDEAVKAVFLQIISRDHPKYSDKDVTGKTFGTYGYTEGSGVTKFVPTADDWNYLQSVKDESENNVYKIYHMATYNAETKTGTEWPPSDTSVSAKPEDYGILADFKGSAWSLKINTQGEFNPKSGTNDLYVCGYAYDGEKKFNLPQYRYMKVDADSPIIDNKYLVLTSDSETSKEYTDGVYVKGAWTLEFDLTDGDAIAKVYVGVSDDSLAEAKTEAETEKSSDTTKPDDDYFSPKISKSPISEDNPESISEDNPSDYNIKCELKTESGVGSKYIYVLFADKKGNYGESSFTVNYDNKEPEISSKNISVDVLNSNGWYTLGADITESVVAGKNQSGFDKFAFYFKRGDKVFDPMISKKTKKTSEDDNPNNYVTVSGDAAEDGLYWKEETVERDSNNLNSFTLESANAHVHAGGLVKLGGTIYTILSVSDVNGTVGTTVTIDGQPKSSITSAYFAYANVIDNTRQEIGSGSPVDDSDYGYGYYSKNNITNDDGDLMVEWVNTIGTKSSISASINSKNIPDGPVEIHYVAFDKAGNSVTGSVKNAYVKNNGPRLANVTVGTDYNYDGTIADNEKRSYFADGEKPGTWDKALTKLSLGSDTLPWIAAKADVVVTPEIIGGNGDLNYTLTYTKNDNTDTTTDKTKISKDTPDEEQKKRTVNAITITKTLLSEAASGKGLYAIKISDSTETTAQFADISLYMKNDVNDSEPPVGKIHRFYWKGLNDNSIYDSKSATTFADLKGHIELESDWKNASGYDKSASGEYDGDPKVSGKIVIKGSAFDNAGIKSLSLKIPGILNTATQVAECSYNDDGVKGSWSLSTATLETDGYSFAIDKGSEIFNNTGHYIRWTLELDTEKYNGDSGPAAADVDIILSIIDKNETTGSVESSRTVYATEKQAAAGKYYSEIRFAEAEKNKTEYVGADYVTADFKEIGDADTSGTEGINKYEVTYVPSNYQVDIVPYITKVTTELSKVNDTNGVTDRSSLGHYPVYVYKNSATSADGSMTDGDAETVKIYGFNFGTAIETIETTFTSASSSGAYSLSVNGVETLNNKNNDNSHGSYSASGNIAPGGDKDIYDNYYNRQPNGQNNNNLTDDVYFDVWQINNRAAVPMSGTVDDPQMKINPANGKIGFAYSNGSSAFNMPNSTYSWTYWAYDYDKVRYIALNYEPDTTGDGKVWAAAVGQDTHTGGGDPFFLESNRWREVGGEKDKNHSTADVTSYSICRLERINQKGGKNESNEAVGETRNIAQDRIQSPAIASTETGLYMAYYDSLNLELRYKSGLLSKAGTGNESHSFDSFQDEATDNNNHYSHANVQIIVQETGKAGEYKPGPYVSIAAIPKGAKNGQTDSDTVVMVWSDTNGTMYYAYNMNPTANKNVVGAKDWTVSTSVFDGKTITYCQVATDYKGGVHIAAYDSTNADVLYAYLPKYDGSVKTATVDSYDSTGVYLTLDVALDANNNPMPQIGYFSMASGRPKYATWNSAKGNLAETADINGVDASESFTGLWEVTNVPTASKVRKSNTGSKVKQNVGVGVWKTGDGKIKNSTSGTSFAVASSSGVNATNYGDVYGNGTENAVISYMIGSDSAASIETAQKK